MGDLKLSVRHLLKTPGFTAAAILVLALGIGLNAAMFSVVYAFTLAGRAYADADRVVQLYVRDTRTTGDYRPFSYPVYQELARAEMFSGVLAHNPTIVGIGDGMESRRALAAVVSANYFDVLGVPLLQGRTFTAQEDRPGQDLPVVVASYAYLAADRVRSRPRRPDDARQRARLHGHRHHTARLQRDDERGGAGVVLPARRVPHAGHRVHGCVRAFAPAGRRVQPVPGRATEGRRRPEHRGRGPRAVRPEPGAKLPGRARAPRPVDRAAAEVRDEHLAVGRNRSRHARRRDDGDDRRRAAHGVPEPRVDAAGSWPGPPQGVRGAPRHRRRPRPHRSSAAGRRPAPFDRGWRVRHRARPVRRRRARGVAVGDPADHDRARRRQLARDCRGGRGVLRAGDLALRARSRAQALARGHPFGSQGTVGRRSGAAPLASGAAQPTGRGASGALAVPADCGGALLPHGPRLRQHGLGVSRGRDRARRGRCPARRPRRTAGPRHLCAARRAALGPAGRGLCQCRCAGAARHDQLEQGCPAGRRRGGSWRQAGDPRGRTGL